MGGGASGFDGEAARSASAVDRAARLALVEEHVRAENAHDLDAVMATFGEQACYEDSPWAERHEGRAGVQRYYESLLRALPDLQIDVRRRHVTDDHVLLEVLIRGTHEGAWHGAPATGRAVELPLCAVYSFGDDGCLSGERIYYDRAIVMEQIGLACDPASWRGRLGAALGHPLTLLRAGLRALRGR